MAKMLDSNEMFFTNFEPKVKQRFIMYVAGIPSFILKRCDRPKIDNGEIVIPHMNGERYVKGKSKWQPINMELYDPIVPSGAVSAMEWIRLGHESVTGRDGYFDMYAKDITINVFGPLGDICEEWTLKGAWVQNGDFGDLGWDAEEYVGITLSVRYNYAILQF